jgi:UDP-N-acetylmuramoyl-L-alanyl-D-glutamate--2,6-diaminopimelate ligase
VALITGGSAGLGLEIALALARAGEGDTVVIAGKGHEQGQEFEEGRKVPFDDRAVAREELQRLAKAAAG